MVNGSKDEDEFDAIRNSELIEDAEQVLLNRILAEAEFTGDIAIAERRSKAPGNRAPRHLYGPR